MYIMTLDFHETSDSRAYANINTGKNILFHTKVDSHETYIK